MYKETYTKKQKQKIKCGLYGKPPKYKTKLVLRLEAISTDVFLHTSRPRCFCFFFFYFFIPFNIFYFYFFVLDFCGLFVVLFFFSVIFYFILFSSLIISFLPYFFFFSLCLSVDYQRLSMIWDLFWFDPHHLNVSPHKNHRWTFVIAIGSSISTSAVSSSRAAKLYSLPCFASIILVTLLSHQEGFFN